MFIELGAIGLIYGAYYRFFKKRMYYDYKNKLNRLYAKNNSFSNALGEVPVLLDVKEIEEGIRLIFNISGILSLEQLEKQNDFIKTYFRVKTVRFKRLETGLIVMDLIDNLDTKEFKIVPTKPYELFVGYSEEGEALKVNLNSFPHMLIGGDSGTGKSRFLMMVLSNLIANSKNVNIYLSQIRKSDLRVFSDCYQVKYIATDLERTRELLSCIDNMCRDREKKLDRLIKQGIYNIEDYNNRFKNNKLNYCYLVLEEFSFYNTDKADTKEIKKLKNEILGLIKGIVNVGRSYGIFVITALQKPTNDSIPTAIKAQLTTRISFKMLDTSTSLIVLGNDHATKLNTRECICRTIKETICKIPFIDHKLLMKAIKESQEKDKKYINLNTAVSSSPSGVATTTTNNDGIINLGVFKNVKQ